VISWKHVNSSAARKHKLYKQHLNDQGNTTAKLNG